MKNTKKLVKIDGKIYELTPVGVKSAKKDDQSKFKDNYKRSLEWFKTKFDIHPVQTGLKVKLPTKSGLKEYDAIKFNNNRIGVVLSYGAIKYAWN